MKYRHVIVMVTFLVGVMVGVVLRCLPRQRGEI